MLCISDNLLMFKIGRYSPISLEDWPSVCCCYWSFLMHFRPITLMLTKLYSLATTWDWSPNLAWQRISLSPSLPLPLYSPHATKLNSCFSLFSKSLFWAFAQAAWRALILHDPAHLYCISFPCLSQLSFPFLYSSITLYVGSSENKKNECLRVNLITEVNTPKTL